MSLDRRRFLVGGTLALVAAPLFARGRATVLREVPPAYRGAALAARVPPRLLYAIALQESAMAFGQHVLPWLWTLNIQGTPHRYASEGDAVRALTRTVTVKRIRNVDCGPMQVNWGYHYAKLGEAAILPEEAQEAGTHNVDRESLHQRKQVLESCLAQLELRKATRAGRDWRRTVGERIDGRTVAEFMSAEVRSVHKSASIKEAGRLLQKWRIGSLLVDDGSRYIGIITDTDLSRKAVAKGLDPNTTTVLSCMSKSVVTIEDSEPLMEALRLMKKEGIRHLPVTEDGTIIGVLSVGDLLRAYQKVLEL